MNGPAQSDTVQDVADGDRPAGFADLPSRGPDLFAGTVSGDCPERHEP